jgi:hypothetical protein
MAAIVITPAEFKAFFPEFAEVPDEVIQERGIDLAVCFVECWCLLGGSTCERQILLFIAAHFLVLGLEEIEGNPGTYKLALEEREDLVSVRYGAILYDKSRLDAFLSLTSYGQIALALLNQLVACRVGPFYQI